MSPAIHMSFHHKLIHWSRLLSGFVILYSLLVLAGWLLDVKALRQPFPNTIAMNPVAAVLFILGGTGLLIKTSNRHTGIPQMIASLFSFLLITIAVLKIADVVFDFPFNIDSLFFSQKPDRQDFRSGNELDINSVFCFMMTGIALSFLHTETKGKRLPSQYFAVITILLSLLALITYIYRVQAPVSDSPEFIPLGTYSAFLFLVLSVAILFVYPGKGLMKHITGNYSGSANARMLIPAAIVIPIFLGLLRVAAYRAGLISLELGMSLLVFVIILLFLAFIWYSSKLLNKRDFQRERIRSQLKEREAQVQSIFRSAPDAVIVIDDTGVVLNWNKKAEEMFGWKKSEAVGKLLTDTIIPDRYKALHREGLKRFSESGQGSVINRTVELFAVDKNNREFQISLSVALTSFPNRKVFIGFIRDITEQKQAEENIRYNSLLVDNVSDAVISTDEHLRIKSWNDAAEKMYGYTAEEVKGRNISFLGLILSPETLLKHQDSVKQQGFYRDEYTVQDKNGKEITILASFNVIKLNNKITGYVAVHRDISIRKILEAQLRTFNKDLSRLVEEKTAEMKSVFDRVSDAFLAVDKDWKYIYANKQLGEMIKKDPQALIGKNMWEVFPDSVGSVTHETFMRAMQEQHYICSTDYYAPLDLWQENHIYPSPNGLSVFIRDVSERKKAEEKIVKANRLYFFISQVNQMIVHTQDEETLFKESCRIAVDTGKFKMAWIGLIDEKSNTVVPVMHAGDTKEHKIIKPVKLDETDLSNPVAAVIIEGKNQVNNDLTSIPPNLGHCAGFKSCMSVALRRSGKTVGVFSFYTDIKDFFDPEEISLLEEAASDISFAMDVLEKERIKKITEHALKHSEEKYRSLIEQAADAIALFDNRMHILDVNQSASHLLGYSREELLELSLTDVLSSVELKTNPVNFELLEKGESTIKPRVMIRKNGEVVETEVHAKKLPDGTYLALIRDLTERKKAELELKQSYEAIRELVSHLQDIREEERLKMAQEIHDELGQQLTIMKMDVSWLDQKLKADHPKFKEKTEALKQMLDGTVKTVRRIASELRPSVLDDMGLAVAIEWHTREIEKRSGIKIILIADNDLPELDDHTKISLFRVVQESLTNVVRYSKATEVHISLEKIENNLTLTIRDNGIGFEPESIAIKKTLGILGMRERIATLNGRFNLESSVGKGTTIKVVVPLQA